MPSFLGFQVIGMWITMATGPFSVMTQELMLVLLEALVKTNIMSNTM